MIKYIKVFTYSCIFCFFSNLIMGAAGAALIYFSKGHFYYPLNQVVRAFIFGAIAGSAITLAAILFRLIDFLRKKEKS